MTAPTVLGTPDFYCNTPDEGGQRSRICHARVRFDQPVEVIPGAFSVTRDNGPDGTTGPVGVLAIIHDQPDGTCDVVLTFSGGSVEYWSLKDGNYTLRMDPTAVTARDDVTPAQAAGPWGCHRLFGDSDGDRQTAYMDFQTFQATYRSRLGQPGYKAYLDFDGNGIIDASDNYQFLARYKKRLEPDGTLTTLP